MSNQVRTGCSRAVRGATGQIAHRGLPRALPPVATRSARGKNNEGEATYFHLSSPIFSPRRAGRGPARRLASGNRVVQSACAPACATFKA